MAYTKEIEALAEAIMKYSGYLDPGSALYEARNPGGLKATSMAHLVDAQGNRIFTSVLNGMQALLHDVEFKLGGRSWAALKPDDTLVELAEAYKLLPTVAQAWARFLRLALKDDSITARTSLKRFQ